MRRVAAFHLVRQRPGGRAVANAPAPDGLSASWPGLVLGEQVATAPGTASASGVDRDRSAIFTVWEDEPALEDWLASSPLVAGWDEAASEVFAVRLEPLTAHGTWGGIEPFPGLAGVHGDDRGGPVAVLTWARLRFGRVRRFVAASKVVDDALQGASGRLAAVGIGERPLDGRGTFSLWRSRAALTDFAYGNPAHADVVGRTRSESWFRDELFARFRPYHHQGTWAGIDPLSAESEAGPADAAS